LLTGQIKASKKKINFLNIYGPCLERKLFWTSLANNGLLSLRNLVIAGDLNLTVSSGEVWGGSKCSGPLSNFFISLFNDHNLVDAHPDKLAPTWRNGRSGTDFIAKRLDRFLVSADLLMNTNLFRSVVVLPFVSDHAPILLQLDSTTHPKAYPFKFNPHWLLDNDFNSLVHELWLDPKYLQEEDIQRRVNRKLKDLKDITKGWVKRVRTRDLAVMLKLESNIKVLLQKIADGKFIRRMSQP
jgi:hypothetical protein